MTQNTEKQTTDEGSGLFDFIKKHPNLGRVMAIATLVVSLAPVFPTTVLAGWCGPYAPENRCQSCDNVDSDCGGDTCFAEKIGVCRDVVPQQSTQPTFEYAVPRSEAHTSVTDFSAYSGAPQRAGTSLGCDRSSTIFTTRGPDFASEQRSQARTRREVCSVTYSCYLGGAFCFISEYAFPSETEP